MKTHPQPGWPADGSPGEWLGWDADGILALIRWCTHNSFNQGKGAWVGVRFDPHNVMPGAMLDGKPLQPSKQYPQMFVRGLDTESFVVKHRPAIGARGE